MCVFLGKKGNIIEKPIPPPEPSEPVLPGSVAVGTVSLAVAKTGALLQGIPLYKYIMILNSQKVIQKHTQPPTHACTFTVDSFSGLFYPTFNIQIVHLESTAEDQGSEVCSSAMFPWSVRKQSVMSHIAK